MIKVNPLRNYYYQTVCESHNINIFWQHQSEKFIIPEVGTTVWSAAATVKHSGFCGNELLLVGQTGIIIRHIWNPHLLITITTAAVVTIAVAQEQDLEVLIVRMLLGIYARSSSSSVRPPARCSAESNSMEIMIFAICWLRALRRVRMFIFVSVSSSSSSIGTEEGTSCYWRLPRLECQRHNHKIIPTSPRWNKWETNEKFR